jgi:uncharacterized protein with FMN-binding domain
MKPILNKAAALWQKTNKTQLLRHGVQFLSFLLFPGLFLTVFNALRDVVVALVGGTFAFSTLSGSLVTLAVVLGVTILWGRFFCGYLCTFGALQELLSFAGSKILPGMRKVPERVDKLLKYVKYAVLLAVVLLIWVLQLPVDSSLSPWGVFGALLSGNLTVMGQAVPTLGFGLLLAILILSLFVERAFCRYLCPLGALFTPLSAARLFRIRRIESACTGCQQCTRNCAMGLTVHEDGFVRSGECIDCMRCIAACHPQALKTLPHPAVAGTASALALCGLIQVGKLAAFEEPTVAYSSRAGFSGGQVVSAETSPLENRYVDGVYTGEGNGFRGVISAQITVSGGRISDVTILSSKDDSDFFQRAESGVIPAILQQQSVNVSAVSGATYSSRGILEAVANALQLDTSALPTIAEGHEHGRSKGGHRQMEGHNGFFSMTPPSAEEGTERHEHGDQRTETDQGTASGQDRQPGRNFGWGRGRGQGRHQGGEDKDRPAQSNGTESERTQPQTSPEQTQPTVKDHETESTAKEADPHLAAEARTYPDGVYTGTGDGYRGETEVQVAVEGGKIADITVLSYQDDRQYFSRAQSSLIAAILNAQGVDVSTVSGATFSSNGILEAVADALDIDFTNPNATLSRGRGRH